MCDKCNPLASPETNYNFHKNKINCESCYGTGKITCYNTQRALFCPYCLGKGFLVINNPTVIKNYHVHIYNVIEEMEINTLAYNETKAIEISLQAAKDGILFKKKPDYNLIAIPFEITEEKEKK